MADIHRKEAIAGKAFRLPEDGEPSDEVVSLWHDFAEGLDWYSDYDCGIAIHTGNPEDDALRVDPGDWVVRLDAGGVNVYTSLYFDAHIRERLTGDILP